MTTEIATLGVVLAGGLARRMGGGDKPRTMVGGETILARVIDRLAPQCTRLILNANGDPGRFADTKHLGDIVIIHAELCAEQHAHSISRLHSFQRCPNFIELTG